mgnify:CR=1 FL=1
MDIVVLDGGTTNPGDLSWAPLESLGRLTVYPETPAELVVSRAAGAQALVLNRIVMDRKTLERLPSLEFIGMLATGYNAIDTAAARERGVTVCNVPDYCAQTVAQQAVSLLLALAGNVHRYSALVRSGRYQEAVAANDGARQGSFPLVELAGKKLGLLGYGSIGRRVGAIAHALGMEVLVCSRTRRESPDSVRWVDLPTLFSESDAVSLHCPLTPETHHLVAEDLLARMKPTAYLINTARGGVVDSAALARALNEGRLAGAGLDVLEQEPPAPDDPLLTARNCLITPHMGWASKEARERLIAAVAENLAAYQQGRPRNVVN